MKTINPKALLFEDDRKIIVFSEKRSKYVANNTSRKTVEGYRIDGVLIIDGTKCDNGLVVPCDNYVYLIELKGSDLCHACEQIETTLQYLENHGINKNFFARIVLTKVSGPDLEGTQYKKLSRTIRQKGGNLKKECLVLTENI